jgi:hypothetical protein
VFGAPHTRRRKNKKDYKPETLLKWKADREAEGQDALAGLTRLTEEDLESIVVDAFEEQSQRINEVLNRLEQNDREAADLLRQLLNELGEFREYSTLLDPDSAVKLFYAATYLAELNLGSSAADLTNAASSLSDTLPTMVRELKALVQRLQGMEGQWG